MKTINISEHNCSNQEIKDLVKYLKTRSIGLTVNSEPVGDGDNDADDGGVGQDNPSNPNDI